MLYYTHVLQAHMRADYLKNSSSYAMHLNLSLSQEKLQRLFVSLWAQ